MRFVSSQHGFAAANSRCAHLPDPAEERVSKPRPPPASQVQPFRGCDWPFGRGRSPGNEDRRARPIAGRHTLSLLGRAGCAVMERLPLPVFPALCCLRKRQQSAEGLAERRLESELQSRERRSKTLKSQMSGTPWRGWGRKLHWAESRSLEWRFRLWRRETGRSSE